LVIRRHLLTYKTPVPTLDRIWRAFQSRFVGSGKWFRGMFGEWPLRNADRSGRSPRQSYNRDEDTGRRSSGRRDRSGGRVALSNAFEAREASRLEILAK